MHSDARHSNERLQKALERIYGLHRKEMDFRLDSGPYRDLLVKLGNPQNKLPPTIHVAGTNGKGSTIAMLRSLAENAGMTVHAYTSPHLFRFNERLRVSGKLIEDDALLDAIEHINSVNQDAAITFFEFTSALMFHLFATNPADLVLLETGCGGRLDCTNVIENPMATLITSIGRDHMHILGDTVEKIAFEKAGIMKRGAPCFIAKQRYNEALNMFQKRADELNVTLWMAKGAIDTNMEGAHQRDNAAVAWLAFDTLFPGKGCKEALMNVSWPGRFETLNFSQPLIYDGAHNEDSARVLADTLRECFPAKKLSIVLTLQSHKDPQFFIDAFSGMDVDWYAADLPGGQHPQNGADLAKKIDAKAFFAGIEDAVHQAASDNPDGVIVITGSLYAAQLIPPRLWPNIER